MLDQIKDGLRELKSAENIIEEFQKDADKWNAKGDKKGLYPAQVGLNGFKGHIGHILLVDMEIKVNQEPVSWMAGLIQLALVVLGHLKLKLTSNSL